MPRARRRPGQDPWFPHRAGRDRGGAAPRTDVHDAAVVARDDDQGEKWLAAYVVGADGAEPDPAALRDRLAAALPAYMVPAAVVPLPALPLNPAGKVDRAALPVPGRAALAGDRAYVAPRDATERHLVEICAQVLGVSDVGVRDRLQDLGADSMRIVHVMAAARRAGLGLTLRMLLDSETVEDLAQALGGTPPEGAGPDETREGQESAMMSAPAGGPVDPARAMAAHRVPGAAVALLRDGRLVGVQVYGERSAGDRAPGDPAYPLPGRVHQQTGHRVRRAASRRPGGTRPRHGPGPVSERSTGAPHRHRSHRDPAPPAVEHGGFLQCRRHLVAARRTDAETRHRARRRERRARTGHPVPQGRQPVGARRTAPHRRDRAGLRRPGAGAGLRAARHDGQFLHTPADGLTARDDWAAGHDQHGMPLLDGFRVRPVRAGSGLWSTAADIAQLAAEIRQAHLGCSDLLPAALATQMLTEAFPGSFYGLGTVVDGSLGEAEFGHGGQTAGFQALVSLRLRSGSGCVVLTNGEGGKHVHKEVAASLGRELTVDDD
ncbi:phosphopantetheine-binding protein [Streptomyces thinghirensis]|nr:phosphopantetheine-binding protein [Streptomyces thinghirensis]